jgi:Plexin cytoplasmic RasGAP domain
MVSQFYADIARLPQISDQEMGTSMQQLSIQQNDEFDTIAALKELYIYVTTYKEQVSDRLDHQSEQQTQSDGSHLSRFRLSTLLRWT